MARTSQEKGGHRSSWKKRSSLWIAGTLLALGLLLLFGMSVVLAKLTPGEEGKGFLTTTVDPRTRTIAGEEDDRVAFETPTVTATLWNAFELSGMRAALLQAYESVAHPGTKVIVVYPGMRKEEVSSLFAKKLAWDETQKTAFASLSPAINVSKREGYFYPDTYLIRASSSAEEVHDLLVERFSKEVQARYSSSTANIVNVDLALKIASIIQREAAGKHDMALISGVIWNRLFKDMTLDMDATLQYAKGNEKIGWWPRVTSKDKYLDSPYNTYQNGGLPPTPIANPSLAAINAALNPKKTSALFYIHDKKRRIHTAKTYKEHKANIARYY